MPSWDWRFKFNYDEGFTFALTRYLGKTQQRHTFQRMSINWDYYTNKDPQVGLEFFSHKLRLWAKSDLWLAASPTEIISMATGKSVLMTLECKPFSPRTQVILVQPKISKKRNTLFMYESRMCYTTNPRRPDRIDIRYDKLALRLTIPIEMNEEIIVRMTEFLLS